MENGNNGIGFEGKQILVIFEDGPEHCSKKQGLCTRDNSIELCLDNKHLIPKTRIIRAEVLS